MFYGLWAAGGNPPSPESPTAFTLDIFHHSLFHRIVVVSGDGMSDTTYIFLQIVSEFVLSFSRQLLVPGYQEIWYTADGARKSSSPASTVSLWDSLMFSNCSGELEMIIEEKSISILLDIKVCFFFITRWRAVCWVNCFCLPGTLFLPWRGFGHGGFKCCC